MLAQPGSLVKRHPGRSPRQSSIGNVQFPEAHSKPHPLQGGQEQRQLPGIRPRNLRQSFKDLNTKDREFTDVVKSAEPAAVLVLGY